MNGHHQNRDIGELPVDFPSDIEAVEVWHLKIEQNHVRWIFLDPFQRFPSGPGFVADLPGTLLLKQGPKIVPDRRVVVDHKNSNHATLPLTRQTETRYIWLPRPAGSTRSSRAKS